MLGGGCRVWSVDAVVGGVGEERGAWRGGGTGGVDASGENVGEGVDLLLRHRAVKAWVVERATLNRAAHLWNVTMSERLHPVIQSSGVFLPENMIASAIFA